MPVKYITSQDTSTDPMVIDKSEYETGRANFKAHYFLTGCNPNFNGQDIAIFWDDLNNAVNAFCETYSVDPSIVATRFVYCFDNEVNSIFLRLQILTMQQEAIPGSNTYLLVDPPSAWYEISEGSMIPTQDNSLEDPVYLANIYYCYIGSGCAPQNTQQLAGDGGDTFARTCTFPWQSEINMMYKQNGSPQGASICFGACSYYNAEGRGELGLWPHGMVLYLRDSSDHDMLNDQSYIVMYQNKGCDMGTLCPPSCNVYIGLPVS